MSKKEGEKGEKSTKMEGEGKIALITGVTGQDGSYLSELLLEKGYKVYGIIRRSSSFNTGRIEHLYKDPHSKNAKFFLEYGDLTDSLRLQALISRIKPDEIYNLAAQSHVKVSFSMPEYTSNVDGLGTLRILDAIRACGLEKKTRFYQASTSELYGKVSDKTKPQNEKTPFYPRSPYACAKIFSYWITVNYREAYGIFSVNGILFNHESPRRGKNFVTRKITRAAIRISLKLQDCLYLGNIDSFRDWGHAKDYVRGMWMMLQQEKPEDFVLATGEKHSVREFCEIAFKELGMTIEWKGKKGTIEETGVCKETGQTIIRIDPRYFRPSEVDFLWGDCKKATEVLGWKREYSFRDLVKEMLDLDEKEIKMVDPSILSHQYE